MPVLKDIKKKILSPGIIGQYVHGASTTLGYVTIEKGSILAAHSHPHEQITMILEGSLEMKIGDETHILTEGMMHVIPSNVIHSAIAHSECKLIDVFSPVREEYR
jgi:quercetin dioxygenase-like cupin family protein